MYLYPGACGNQRLADSGTIYYKDSCNIVHTTSYSVSKYSQVSLSVLGSTPATCPGDTWFYSFGAADGQGTYEYSLDNSSWTAFPNPTNFGLISGSGSSTAPIKTSV